MLGPRGRLNLTNRWLQMTGWKRPAGVSEWVLLVVFRLPGRLSLLPWDPDGPRVEMRYKELAAADPPDEEGMRRIVDRYNRLPVPIDRRCSLGEPALTHLGLVGSTQEHPVWIAAFPNRIDILAPRLRDAELVAGAAVFDDLP